jgi:hypothetical protein
MTIGQVFASCISKRLARCSSPGTESGGYGAVFPGSDAMASAKTSGSALVDPDAEGIALEDTVRDIEGVGRGVEMEG